MTYTLAMHFAPLAAALAKVCQTVDGWDVPPDNAEKTYWETSWARHARGASIVTFDDLDGALWALGLLASIKPPALFRDDAREELEALGVVKSSSFRAQTMEELAHPDKFREWVDAKMTTAYRNNVRRRAEKMMHNACARRPGPLTEMQRTMRGIHRDQIDRWMGY